MVLRKELGRFCSNTSMKGLPRIAKSESSVLRYSWLVFVCALLAVSLTQCGDRLQTSESSPDRPTLSLCSNLSTKVSGQVYYVVSGFIKFPVVTTLQQKMLHRNVFPSITVCSNAAVSKRNIAAHRITPLEDYLAMVEKRLVCPGCDAEETQAMEDIKLELMTPDGYTTYLGAETASKAGFTLQEILVDCHVSFRVGVGFIHRNCDDFFNITLLFYSKYFNCFRYDPIPTSTVVLDSSKNLTLNATPSQMVMILNLANDHVSSVYNPRATSWHSAGAYVMVTDPREVQPAVGFDGVNVPVGMLSNIGVSLTERVTMVPPHGECVPSDIDKSREEIKNCFVNRVRETCGCIDVDPIFHVNVSDMRTMSDEYCMSLAHGYSNMMKNIQCVLAARQGNLSCFNNLSRMCEEHNYKKVVSHSHWPVRTHLPSVASFLTKNSASLRPRQLHLFNRAKNCKADSTSSECVELLKQTEVEILNSFAQFCVGASDYMYISMVDEAKVGWSEFSSQIGGILNLWSGITAVLLLEILEMLYRTLRGWVQPVEPEIHNDRDASSVTCPKCGSTDRLPSNYYNNKPV